MNILVFSPYYPPHTGGLENYAHELNKNLTQKHINVTVIAPQLPGDAPAEEICDEVRIIRFPAFEIIPNYPLPKFWDYGFWKILSSIQNKNFAFTISHTRFFFISSLLAFTYSRKSNIKWIHIEHGSDFVQLNNFFYSWCAKTYDLTFGKLTLTMSDEVVAISEAVAKFVKKLQPKTNPRVIYRGFDFQKIDAVLPSTISKQTPLIVYFGRLISGKGVADLIHALSYLKNETFLCQIIGDGPELEKLQNLSRKLGLEKQISFTGKKSWNETMSLIKTADIIVNPSYTEGLPTALIEAALCKKAIVATNVGGTEEIITNNQSGLLVEPNNPKDLSWAIQELLRNEELREEFGKNAREHVIRILSWEKCTTEFINIFNKHISKA